MKVEIWSDILCPFCYIGKREFEAALDMFENKNSVEVVQRSYELSPDAPAESDDDMHQMLAKKMGSDYARAKALNDQVTLRAESVGLKYDLDRAHPTNSFDAHRLVHLAAAHRLSETMIERLYDAHFCEAINIGKKDNLKMLAEQTGLDAAEVDNVLAGGAYADDVHADEDNARQLGVPGVPFFLIDGEYAVTGAQPNDIFLETLKKAAAGEKRA